MQIFVRKMEKYMNIDEKEFKNEEKYMTAF